MNATMRAARLIEAGKPLEIQSIPVPEPAAGELLVEVHACGICGTDLHLAVDGDIPVERTPITLGHEAAGVVVRLGEGVSDFSEGDRVALFPAAYCGECAYCKAGRQSLCEHSKVYGMARDGSLANFVTAPAHSAFHLPDKVPFDVGAVVTDAVSTPYHALVKRGKLQKGETVGVIGCGGLGSHAIQLAKLLGADHIIGIAAFVSRELTVLGSFGMDRSDIEDLYELVAKGKLDLIGSISVRYPLEQANDALQHLARRDESVVRVIVEPVS